MKVKESRMKEEKGKEIKTIQPHEKLKIRFKKVKLEKVRK